MANMMNSHHKDNRRYRDNFDATFRKPTELKEPSCVGCPFICDTKKYFPCSVCVQDSNAQWSHWSGQDNDGEPK